MYNSRKKINADWDVEYADCYGCNDSCRLPSQRLNLVLSVNNFSSILRISGRCETGV